MELFCIGSSLEAPARHPGQRVASGKLRISSDYSCKLLSVQSVLSQPSTKPSNTAVHKSHGDAKVMKVPFSIFSSLYFSFTIARLPGCLKVINLTINLTIHARQSFEFCFKVPKFKF